MSAKLEPAPFLVMSSIHGPRGWFDVIDSERGVTVATCPSEKMARRIAALLSEEVPNVS